MAIVSSDISNDYTINIISGSLAREERVFESTKTTGAAGSKVVSFTTVFGSVQFPVNEILRISDGVTTVNYTLVDTSGGTDPFNAASAVEIGQGGNRATNLAVAEFVSKINASALDITAVANAGGNSSSASMTLTPGSGKTITITESPGGDGEFGDGADKTVITDGTTTTTVKHRAAPFRVFIKGAPNIRGQKADSGKQYKTFIGKQIV
tara:strand:+ start:3779 stop:4405 length:627 start_codon:yes stop_codon:yes gene_type:complete